MSDDKPSQLPATKPPATPPENELGKNLESPQFKFWGMIGSLILVSVAATYSVLEITVLGPKNDRIEQLSKELDDAKSSSQPPKVSEADFHGTAPSQESLPYSVTGTVGKAAQLKWVAALTEKLAKEGEAEPDVRLLVIEYKPFDAAYQRFHLDLRPLEGTTITGGYAFHAHPLGTAVYYAEIPLDPKSRDVFIPQSSKGDYVLLLIRLTASHPNILPTGSEMDNLISIKVKL